MSCVFCTAPESAGELVFEDDAARVLLHPDRAVAGHAMIVAKRHVENVADLDEAEWLQIARLWHRVERALLALTNVERSIVMKLGIQTPHLHIHLYPVGAGASRDEVFAVIDAKMTAPRDEQFVNRLRTALLTERRP